MSLAGPLERLASPECLGEALDRATREWSEELCLVEANRQRENERLTYRQLRRRALPLAAWMDGVGFESGDRAAIIMTNQSKWHLSAFAILHRGGVLVPLDFMLSGPEHIALLAHSRPKVAVVEWHLWRRIASSPGFDALRTERVLVTEAPTEAVLPAPEGVAVYRWEDCRAALTDERPRPRAEDDVACVVYSSGTGGAPKGCLLTHGNYLAQLASLVQLHPLAPGHRYLSILPTNHAIDFMVGFIGPYVCGASVIHLRTLRPELVREAFARYGVTHVALVPAHLGNLEAGLRQRIDDLTATRRAAFELLRSVNRLLTRGRPRPGLARHLLRPVHQAFGGRLEAIFVGGASSRPATLRFFHGLGIPVANGYGLTEAGTAITLDRMDPPRPETVGMPLPGVEVRIAEPNDEGVGEVAVRSAMVMSGYLDDEDLTRETLVGGWLMTGDLGRLEDGHLRLFGRRKNMIVTAGGKNVYPEDIETAFEGSGAEELCVFAVHFLWPDREGDERLVLLARDGEEADLLPGILACNRRLPDYQRISGVVAWEEEFPRTASMKIKRSVLAEQVRLRYDEMEGALIPLPASAPEA